MPRFKLCNLLSTYILGMKWISIGCSRFLSNDDCHDVFNLAVITLFSLRLGEMSYISEFSTVLKLLLYNRLVLVLPIYPLISYPLVVGCMHIAHPWVPLIPKKAGNVTQSLVNGDNESIYISIAGCRRRISTVD